MTESNKKILPLLIVLALFLAGAGEGPQGVDERLDLLRKQKELNEKIGSLRREEDFLLFKKTFYGADSKYLILNLAAGTGQLRYKNRVLKGFTFSSSAPRPGGALARGMITLTKKEDRRRGRLALFFGDSLVLRSKSGRMLPHDVPMLRLYLHRKDLASVFYALEEGAKAYLLR